MGEERVFAAEDGRLWGASIGAGATGPDSLALVFTCVTEARQGMRAVAVDAGSQLRDFSDDSLRGWLAKAPKVEKLN
jgi:hypothetical protein